MAKKSVCKSGIRLASNDLRPSPRLITKVQWALSWSTLLMTLHRLMRSKIGLSKSKPMPLKTLSKSLSVTNAIYPIERYLMTKVSSSLPILVSSFLKSVLSKAKISKKHFIILQNKSKTKSSVMIKLCIRPLLHPKMLKSLKSLSKIYKRKKGAADFCFNVNRFLFSFIFIVYKIV